MHLADLKSTRTGRAKKKKKNGEGANICRF